MQLLQKGIFFLRKQHESIIRKTQHLSFSILFSRSSPNTTKRKEIETSRAGEFHGSGKMRQNTLKDNETEIYFIDRK